MIKALDENGEEEPGEQKEFGKQVDKQLTLDSVINTDIDNEMLYQQSFSDLGSKVADGIRCRQNSFIFKGKVIYWELEKRLLTFQLLFKEVKRQED